MTNHAEQERLVKQLLRYIDVPSRSGDEQDYLRALEADLTGRGFCVERQVINDSQWNLLALPSGEPDIVFCTHIDVVPPHIGASVRGGRVWGRGACDTKGGLVAMMAAADRLDPDRNAIGFLLVVNEEVDHSGASAAAELAVRPKAIVLCEPTTGNLVSSQKGMLKVILTSTGVAAHSAFPELGRNALSPLLDTLERLRTADYPTDPVLGDTNLNIGLLESGIAANVTPAGARAELVYRAATDDVALLEQIRSLCHPDVTVEVGSTNPPIVLPTVDGFPLENIAFNTDAFYLQPVAPVYLMGPGDIRVAHSVDECISIEELIAGIDDYVRLVEAIG
jgi:acetylornithine deacetylase